MFALTLTNTAGSWFEPIMNGIQEMDNSNKKFLKRFNSSDRHKENKVHIGII